MTFGWCNDVNTSLGERMCWRVNFTDFCFWLDRVARNNRLLDIPYGKCWCFYLGVVYLNVFLSCALVVISVCCFCTGIQNSFLYDKVNCADGSSLASSMCNMVVVLLLIVALKQQQSGWTYFTSFVFTSVVVLLNLFFLYNALLMTFHWLHTQSRTITDNDWPTNFAWIDGATVFTLLFLELTDLILITFYLLLSNNFFAWQSRNLMSQITSHNRLH